MKEVFLSDDRNVLSWRQTVWNYTARHLKEHCFFREYLKDKREIFRMSESEDKVKLNSDLVAVWDVPLHSGLYSIEFEHGTTTGKRIIRANGKVRGKYKYNITKINLLIMVT